ncbi:acyltransferase [Sphingomonas sp.]|uniref:acyltransferase family protein n=1 Tax=Sphingomonas sp. TaxID=28214 RepID=UPI002ED960A9
MLRGLAAVAVMLTHSTYYATQKLDPAFSSWGAGGYGVDLFFVISGFVVGSAAERAQGWRSFATARAIRILPLYWIATTLALALTLLAGQAQNIGHVVASYFLFPSWDTHGDPKPILAVGWTLILEAVFYGVLTFALALRVDTRKAALLGLGGLALLGTVLGDRAGAWSVPLSPLSLEFCLGMAVREAVLRGWTIDRPLAAVSLCGALIILFSPQTWDGAPRLIGAGLPAAVAVWAAVSLEGIRIPRPLLLLGAVSYPLYLFHPMMARVAVEVYARAGLGNVGVATAMAIIASVAVAAGIDRLLPLLSRGRASNRTAPSQGPDQQIAEEDQRADDHQHAFGAVRP